VFCTVNGLACLCVVFGEAGMSEPFSKPLTFNIFIIILIGGIMTMIDGWGRIGVIVEASALGIMAIEVCRVVLYEKKGERLRAFLYYSIPMMCFLSVLGYLLYDYYLDFAL